MRKTSLHFMDLTPLFIDCSIESYKLHLITSTFYVRVPFDTLTTEYYTVFFIVTVLQLPPTFREKGPAICNGPPFGLYRQKLATEVEWFFQSLLLCFRMKQKHNLSFSIIWIFSSASMRFGYWFQVNVIISVVNTKSQWDESKYSA